MAVMANLLQRMPKKKVETETKKLQAEIEEAQKKFKEAKGGS
jgi:hypothetical protein